MTTRPSAEAIAQRIPTRPVCHKCQRYITIDTEADDDLWAEVIGEKFGPGYICADCFTRAADERLIRWEDRVRLIPYSLASQIGVQNEAARELDAGREVYGPRSNGDMVVALLVAGGFVSEDKAAQAREIVAELSHPQAAEVGEGMVTVPRQLTWEMRGAIQQAFIRSKYDQLQAMHTAMIHAALTARKLT